MDLFYEESGQKIGPIKITDIKPNLIDRDTLVWHKDLDNWIKADTLPELTKHFNSIPPPLPSKKELVIKAKYDKEYDKESEATSLGVFIVIISIALYFLRKKVFSDEEHQIYFLIFAPLLALGCAIYASKTAKELNRNQGGWFMLTLFLPSIALIILGQLHKLKERRVSDFERELDRINKEDEN